MQKPSAEYGGICGRAQTRLGCLGHSPASLLMCVFFALRLPIAAFCLSLTPKMSSGEFRTPVYTCVGAMAGFLADHATFQRT